MSSRRMRFPLAAALVLGLALASFAVAASQDHGKKHQKGLNNSNTLGAVLIGHNETPAIHTAGQGTLSLTINSDNTMSYTLTYSGLGSTAMQAHVHLGQPDVAGGVAFWLCGGGGKPTCPAGNTSTPETVTGTVAAADVLPIPTQGLAALDLAGIVQEIRAGFTYANVHTMAIGAGEIRGQIGRGHGHGQDDNDD
jgi:hypothetical protein